MARKKTTGTPDRLKKIEGRLLHLEKMLQDALSSSASKMWNLNASDAHEAAVAPWQFLVRRSHPWRKQLYLKGRNMTARQLVGSIQANQLDDEKAAANYRLPLAAIREAQAYVANNLELLETEAEIERLMHQRERAARVAQPVS